MKMFILLALSLLITVLGVVVAALAESPIEFHPCSAKTCKSPEESTQKALGGGSISYLLPSQVMGLSDVSGCDRCTKILAKSGKSVYVLGTPSTVACVLFGGATCDHKVTK